MRRTAVTLLAAALLLGACTDDDPTLDPDASPDPTTTSEAPEPSPSPTATTSTPAAAGEAEGEEAEEANTDDEVQMTAELTPEAEVPGPGDDGASGSFEGTMELREASGELCYELTASGVSSEVVSAHIHRGEADEAGEIVIELQAPVDGSSSGCETVEAMDLVPLLEETSSYYVNVHSQDHPDGAVRGQLERD